MKFIVLFFSLSFSSLYASGGSGGGGSAGGGGGSAGGSTSSSASMPSASAIGATTSGTKINKTADLQKEIRNQVLAIRKTTKTSLSNNFFKKNVQWKDSRKLQTLVAYKDIDYTKLKKNNRALAATARSTVDGWSKNRRYAYYMNLYNSLTLEVVREHYPIKSIKDINNGNGPWDDKFFELHGQKSSLNDIEHKIVRGASDFDQPNVHFGFNCASIGCPALLPLKFTEKNVNKVLDIAKKKFLKDRSKNYVNYQSKTVYLSPIFDWYKKDFEQGHNGISSLSEFVQKNAGYLANTRKEKQLLESGSFNIKFSNYDWKLNDI